MKHLSLLLIAMIFSMASFAQISGPTSVCIGTLATYTDPTPGGTWSCSATTVASVGTVSGTLVGVSAGTVMIFYTMPSSAVDTFDVTVNAVSCGLSSGSICTGASTTLSGCLPGGVWSSSSASTASIDPSTGLVTGGAPGIAVITFTLATGCAVTTMVTVNPAPLPITGSTSVCLGSTTTFSDAAVGGTWTNSNTAVATINTVAGIFSGVAAGTTTINYILPATGCSASALVVINSLPAAHTVTGGGSYCAGGSGVAVGLDGSDLGILYQLYNGLTPVGAPIAGTGTVLNFGLQTVPGTYTVIANSTVSGCTGSMAGSVTVTVGALPVAYTIAGGGAYCAGSSGVDITLSGSETGVDYQLYLGGSPVGLPLAGTGGVLDFGVVTGAGSYSIEATSAAPGCTSAMSGIAVISINPMPAAYTVTGGGSYCTGGTGVDVGLDGSSTGVNYQLYLGGVTVGLPVAGTGLPVDFGLQTAAGVYTVVATNDVTACTNNMTGSATVTITPLPTAYTITGAGGSYCAGGTGADVALSSSDLGVTYALYNGATLVTSLSGTGAALDFGDQLAGTYTITASGTGSCTAAMTGSFLITISALPTITAYTSSVACDGSYTLNAGGGVSYTWAGAGLSCTACASPNVNPTASATYTVTGTDGSGCVNTATTSVDGNRISGTISPAVSGDIRVWLVQFNPADSSIAALDSTTTCTSGGTQYYEFPDPASGNYMVKAYELGGTPGTSGYIPTYSSSAPHWDAAATVSHTSATDYMNVTMIYGTVPAGPGFIGGYIASGAGKGTSDGVPVGGMLVYLTDAANNIITYTYTDGSGNYGFMGLADGNYIIYPEFYQYATTASSVITLGGSSETVSSVNFKQHTSNRTITPYDYTSGVTPLSRNGESIMVYPNPAAGNLTIQWGNQSIGKAYVVITDIVGREVYKSVININAASGLVPVALNGLTDGIYILTIKNESIYYCNKLVIQQ